MNRKRVLELADLIESLPEEQFTMNSVRHECGSPACIAGWAAWLQLGMPTKLPSGRLMDWGSKFYSGGDEVIDAACEFIGSSDYVVRGELFMGAYGISECEKIDSEEAVRVLRHFAATGEVNWELPA